MSSDRDVSRRRFLSTAVTTTAASFLAKPALSFALGTPSSSAAAETGATASPILPWQDQGVLNLTNSPFAKLHTVPVRAVTIEEGFWSKRRKTNVESSIPSMRTELEEHGRMDNYRRLVGKSSAAQTGPFYTDSDIYKWTEAVGWTLQSGDQPELRKVTESMIREVVAIQEPSGYLNTYFQGDHIPERMTPHMQEVGTRTLQPRPHAAGSHRLLSRDGRPYANECRDEICRRFSHPQLWSRDESETDYFRSSRN